MKKTIDLLLLLAIGGLVFAGIREAVYWKKHRVSQPNPALQTLFQPTGTEQTAAQETASTPTSFWRKQKTSTSTDTTARPTASSPQQAALDPATDPEDSPEDRRPFSGRGDLPKHISFEATGFSETPQGQQNIEKLVTSFNETMKKISLRIPKTENPKAAFVIAMTPLDRTKTFDRTKEYLLIASLEKTNSGTNLDTNSDTNSKRGSEKWLLKYSLKKGDGPNATSLAKKEVPFPRSNPLPTHKIFYTDEQMGEHMAHFLEAELAVLMNRFKPGMANAEPSFK